MNIAYNIFKLVVLFLVLVYCYCGHESRILLFHGFSDCPEGDKNPSRFNGTVTNITQNVYGVSGEVEIDDHMTGPIEMQLNGKRCDIHMNQCEHYNTFVIRDICRIINQKNQYWSNLIAHTEPRAKCPFKASTIKIINATLDFAYLAHLPMDGYTWIVTLKFFKQIANIRHRKRLLFCIMSEGTILKKRFKTKRT